MTHSIRSILALTIIAIVLAACSTTVGAPTSDVPTPSQPATPVVEPSVEPSVEPTLEPSVEPEAPSEEPAPAEREVDGFLTVYPGIASGPGGSIQDALDAGPTGNDLPTLVNGVIFRDTDGRIYLATSVSDVEAPGFDGPMLEVLGYPNDGESWDMANAELLGLEEANGIIFQRDTQLLGTLELP